MSKFNAGDRVEHNGESTWGGKGETGTVLDPTVTTKFGDDRLASVKWDKGTIRNDPKVANLSLVSSEPALGGGSLTTAQVNDLRARAVKEGETLRPGAYRYVYGQAKFYDDILVLNVDAPKSKYVDGRIFTCVDLDGKTYRDRFYRDAGLEANIVKETCNLGHVHESNRPYAVNFLVPLNLLTGKA